MLLIARVLAVSGSHSPHARAALQLQHTHTAKAARRQTVAHEGQRMRERCHVQSVAAAAAEVCVNFVTKQLGQLQKLFLLIQSLSNSTPHPPDDVCVAEASTTRDALLRGAVQCCCMIFGTDCGNKFVTVKLEPLVELFHPVQIVLSFARRKWQNNFHAF
jgi:hypothetical protein